MITTKRNDGALFLHTGYGLVARSVRTGRFERTGSAFLFFAGISLVLLLITLTHI